MPRAYGLNRLLGAAVGTIGLIAVLGSGGALVQLNSLATATKARAHSNEVLRQLNAFLVAMLNQETGLRGYLLSGHLVSLAPYEYGRTDAAAARLALRGLVGNDPVERPKLDDAETAAQLWQTAIGERAVAEMANPATRTQALDIESSGDGRQHFDQLRAALAAIDGDEQQIVQAHEGDTKRMLRLTVRALWADTILILLICGVIGWSGRRLISQPLLQLAATMRRLAQRDLAVEIPSTLLRNEVGEMARAVQVFKESMIELDRTALLRVTADTLPAMIGYIEASGRIGFLNGEFDRWFDLHTEDVSQLSGRRVTSAFGQGVFPGSGQELEAALRGETMRFEQQLWRRDRVLRDVEAIFRPHRSMDGGVLGVVTLLTDITERKQLDRDLLQQTSDLLRSNEELEQFAYVASHDLKAPLRAIENLVSWIEEDLAGKLEGETLTNMDLLKKRVLRLESLLDDLLAYSRAGRRVAADEVVDTAALVAEMTLLSNPPASLVIAAEAGLPRLRTARAPLTQVFQNLISNAIKHHGNPSAGHIWVEARPQPGITEFIVTDDGPGIAEEFHSRVFGMFQTLKPRDDVEGSGMGLAIVKKLVERHSGKVWLEDGRTGHGLAVHFTWAGALAGDQE